MVLPRAAAALLAAALLAPTAGHGPRRRRRPAALRVAARGTARSAEGPQLPGAGLQGAPYYELFYQQRLDHFSHVDVRWPHRFLLGNNSWDGRGRLANGCQGPTLVYAGNEGPIDEFWAGNGFMIEELAPHWGGLLIFPEQRFYGKSLPFGNASLTAEHLVYLTTSQVIEDYAELLQHLKATLPGAAGCPAIAFGGSYGGTLAALLRATHPGVVDGALAASSELGYYDVAGWPQHGVTEFTFEDIVVQDYAEAHPQCLEAIEAAVQLIDATPEAEVARIFKVCEAMALRPTKSDLFVYALEGLPQEDYPYAIEPMPARPLAVACTRLVGALAGKAGTALLAAAAAITEMALGAGDGSCIPTQGEGGPGNTPGDGPGPGAWGWQSCTETLHGFSARGLRTYTFNYTASAEQCASLYGAGVSPNLTALARQFGGYALANGSSGTTRIIWSQGTLDPWHGWFRNITAAPRQSEMHHIIIEGAAHHLDLKAPRLEDPPAVTAARRLEAEIIWQWIQNASRGNPLELA